MLKFAIALMATLALGAGALAQTAPSSPGSAAFACPKTPTLNCMPIVPAERRALCSKGFRDWAATHCPGLQIVY
ncbi:MAG: hypothetical protein ACLPSW_26480 [Roseiarcus sp.]